MVEVTTKQKTISGISIAGIVIGALGLITSFILQYIYTKQVRDKKRTTIPWWITLMVMISTAILTASIYAAIVYGKIIQLSAQVAEKGFQAAKLAAANAASAKSAAGSQAALAAAVTARN